MADVARRGGVIDPWPVVAHCQGLVARPDAAAEIDEALTSARVGSRALRKRIRAGIAAHVARDDRENLAANLLLAVPAHALVWRWLWRGIPLVATVLAGLWSRSWYVAASVYGWAGIAVVVCRMLRPIPKPVVEAWKELDRIRIMASHGDVRPALRLWRKLDARGPIVRGMADVIADGACAIADQGARAALSVDERAELAKALRELGPFLSADCAADAARSVRRLG